MNKFEVSGAECSIVDARSVVINAVAGTVVAAETVCASIA